MHLMIPHASPLDEAGEQARQTLALPRLAELLALLRPERPLGGDAYSPLAPQDLALAQAWGWPLPGQDLSPAASATSPVPVPLAAALAEDDGVAVGDRAWALLTPLHLSVGSDQVTALHPDALQLDEAQSRAAFDSLAELFPAAEGWTRAWGAPSRWYIAHAQLAQQPSASLERVIHRNIDAWLPEAPLLRRLQMEAQMLLHRADFNRQREARGALALNSVWISGCGRAQPRRPALPLQLERGLAEPALAGDWAAWCEAWRALDAGPVAALLAQARAGAPLRLTLVGERRAQSFVPAAPAGLLARWRQRLAGGRADVQRLLEPL